MVHVGEDVPLSLRAAIGSREYGAAASRISRRGGREAPASFRPGIQCRRSAVVSVGTATQSLWIDKRSGHDSIMDLSIAIQSESDEALSLLNAIMIFSTAIQSGRNAILSFSTATQSG